MSYIFSNIILVKCVKDWACFLCVIYMNKAFGFGRSADFVLIESIKCCKMFGIIKQSKTLHN